MDPNRLLLDDPIWMFGMTRKTLSLTDKYHRLRSVAVVLAGLTLAGDILSCFLPLQTASVVCKHARTNAGSK